MSRLEDVYDLSIDDAHEFFANGILVHNCDEIGAWGQYGWDFWNNLMFGLRLGRNPQCIATTTPRPTRLVRYLFANASRTRAGDGWVDNMGKDGNWVHLTTGTTYDNEANLPKVFMDQILGAFEGTRLGKQEIEGELLTDVVGSLWKPSWFEEVGFRIGVQSVPELPRCVVGVDPAATSKKESSAHTGIITVGRGADDHYYTLRDDSVRGTPKEWGEAAVYAYNNAINGEKADHIVAEANNGGEMVQHVIATVDPSVPVRLVYAARGKQTRAEPVSALYQKGKCHHAGHFDALEDEMTTWVPGQRSPDRMDACVWAHTDLMEGKTMLPISPDAVFEASPRKDGRYG